MSLAQSFDSFSSILLHSEGYAAFTSCEVRSEKSIIPYFLHLFSGIINFLRVDVIEESLFRSQVHHILFTAMLLIAA